MAEVLPAYRDRSKSTTVRVDDLLSRMTLAEKAGQLFHNMLAMGPKGTLAPSNEAFDLLSTEELIVSKNMTHFNLLGAISNVKHAADWHNRLQRLAWKKTRLGIPITISTDPRNHHSENPGTGFGAGTFSSWPETLGFAALRDPELVETFANMARQEYCAVGLRMALHPQVDLATEYRWSRIGLTFGEDAELSGKLGAAYVRGFQNRGTDPDPHKNGSVSCTTKHFPGAGPQKDGEDPHFAYGKEQVYPGGQFEYHVKPFVQAIEEGATRWIMPYYGVPVGVPDVTKEEVGFAFNKDIITSLLREKLGYNGIVLTDWGLVSDNKTILGQDMPARAWGCEHLSEVERVVKILEAGCDQFGGESRPELVVNAVEKGLVSESRIDESVRRILTEKFDLGLFDQAHLHDYFVDDEEEEDNADGPLVLKVNSEGQKIGPPQVDPDTATEVVGNRLFRIVGERTQRRSITLLTNNDNILPLSLSKLVESRTKIYFEAIDPSTFDSSLSSSSSKTTTTTTIEDKLLFQSLGLTATSTPNEASIAIFRLKSPHEARKGGFESFFHTGSLEFPPSVIAHIKHISDQIQPTNTKSDRTDKIVIVDVYLDRPVVLTPFVHHHHHPSNNEPQQQQQQNPKVSALTTSYGSNTQAYLDTLFAQLICPGTELRKAAISGINDSASKTLEARQYNTVGPEGQLPFDLPASMDDVIQKKRGDVAFDLGERALFRFGHGLRYSSITTTT